MNEQRIRALIAHLGKVEEENFDMEQWQTGQTGACDSLEEIHACGNQACIGGYLAVSPEFLAAGGSRAIDGSPVYGQYFGSLAMSDYLGIPLGTTLGLFVGERKSATLHAEELVLNRWADWTPADAVEILEGLLSGEFDEYL